MKVFAAIVLAVVAPAAGALVVRQASIWAGYGASERLLLLKGLAYLLGGFLAVTGVIVFCQGLMSDRRKAGAGRVNRKCLSRR